MRFPTRERQFTFETRSSQFLDGPQSRQTRTHDHYPCHHVPPCPTHVTCSAHYERRHYLPPTLPYQMPE